MTTEDEFERAVFDDRPDVGSEDPDKIRFGDLIIKRPKRGSRQKDDIVGQIRFVVGQYPDSKTLALALKEAGISANDAHLLSGALAYDNRDPKIYKLFQRMQSAAARVSLWETDGFRVREEDNPYDGASGRARFARGDGAHSSKAPRLGQDSDQDYDYGE